MEEVVGHGSIRRKCNGTAGETRAEIISPIVPAIGTSRKNSIYGRALRGLQVMGVLETRNLDFKNVFVLSLNEGAFPSFASRGSYVPHNIRRAYGLPTADFQDAMYAYLFYRVLQRAQNVSPLYTTETDDLGEGEMSRYLQQLLHEAGVKCKNIFCTIH